MGFYFRKSANLGPVRLNFSKSGIGVSTGVTGARLIFSPKGTYVHLGRHGLYYKKKIGTNSNRNSQNGQNQSFQEEITFDETIIETSNFANLTDVDSQQFISEFKTKNDKISWAPFVSIVFILINLFLIISFINVHYPIGQEIFSTKSNETAQIIKEVDTIHKANNIWSGLLLISIFLVSSIATILVVRKSDFARKGIEIYYDLDETTSELYDRFLKGFESFTSVQKMWQIVHTKSTDRSKYHGGAQKLIDKIIIKDIRVHKLPNRFFVTNAKIPNISLKNLDLYFLPERILLIREGDVAAIMYKNINVGITDSLFIENSQVPSDAKIVDKTWKYVNKSGGPDRRFNNNRQIPICEYSNYSFQTDEGFKEIISTSKLGGMDDFVQSIFLISNLQNSYSKQSLDIPSDYDQKILSNKATQIIETKPPYWKSRLANELIYSNNKKLRFKLQLLTAIRETRKVPDRLILNKLYSDFIQLKLKVFINEFTINLVSAIQGSKGVDGDENNIIDSVNKLYEYVVEVIIWETELRLIYADLIKTQELKKSFYGTSSIFYNALLDLNSALNNWIESGFEDNLDVDIKIDFPIKQNKIKI